MALNQLLQLLQRQPFGQIHLHIVHPDEGTGIVPAGGGLGQGTFVVQRPLVGNVVMALAPVVYGADAFGGKLHLVEPLAQIRIGSTPAESLGNQCVLLVQESESVVLQFIFRSSDDDQRGILIGIDAGGAVRQGADHQAGALSLFQKGHALLLGELFPVEVRDNPAQP